MNIFELRDKCRKNLVSYTLDAFSIIPEIKNPLILDAGCGTGVTSLALIEFCDCTIYAVDPDETSINRFKEKAASLNLSGKLIIINDSILNTSLFKFKFDIILAEGLLNVTGFEKGMQLLTQNLKHNGYLILHDELKNDSKKRQYFRNNNLKLLSTIKLDENVWLNDYFQCIENKITFAGNENLLKDELSEIAEYKKNPENLRSIYYILQSVI